MKYLFLLVLSAAPLMAAEKAKISHAEHGGHGEDTHEHGAKHAAKEEAGHAHEAEHKHQAAEEDGHEHGEAETGHGHEEGGSRVGPDKGILEASEDKGFRLSPEAVKSFALKEKVLSGSGPWIVPVSARLLSGEEVNLYRVRDGFYKRIDFALQSRKGDDLTVGGAELRAGDAVVIHGVGFLRIAEITAFGGAPEGHSH